MASDSGRTNSTPSYQLTFKIVLGDFVGRYIWHNCWLTPAALPQTKRDLAKIGITEMAELEKPLPQFIRCNCKVALRKDDDGKERNRLVTFEFIGIDEPNIATL